MKDEVEILWRMCNEDFTQARQHETLRASMTTVGAMVSAAAAGFITFDDKLALHDLPLACFVMALGMFGALFSAKHYERWDFSVERARTIFRRIEELLPEIELTRLLKEAEAAQRSRFPRLFHAPVHWFWIGIHGAIAAFGLLLVVLICLESVKPH